MESWGWAPDDRDELVGYGQIGHYLSKQRRIMPERDNNPPDDKRTGAERQYEELIEDLEAPAETQRNIEGGLECQNVSCHKTSCAPPSVLV